MRVTKYDVTLAQTVGQDDRRLIQSFGLDLASARHMAWMRWYYPELTGMASATAYGCPVFCRYCFVDPALKYPKRAEGMLEKLRESHPQANFYTGSEAVARLARLGKAKTGIANRLAQTELFLTPAFALEFVASTLATKRSLAIESTCLALGSDPALAADFARAVRKERKRVRVTAHLLSPSPEMINDLVGREPVDFTHNLQGIAAAVASGVRTHMVFVAFRPPQISPEKWDAALADLANVMRAQGLRPEALELRPTRAYGDTVPLLQKLYPKAGITRRTFADEFKKTLERWQALVPGYQLPYATQSAAT